MFEQSRALSIFRWDASRRRCRVALSAACLFAALMIGALAAHPAAACSVCFGAADDAMVQGTAKGVLLMIGVTYSVLLGMGALMVTWFVRGRRRMNIRTQPTREA
jgi:hypothetical protein